MQGVSQEEQRNLTKWISMIDITINRARDTIADVQAEKQTVAAIRPIKSW